METVAPISGSFVTASSTKPDTVPRVESPEGSAAARDVAHNNPARQMAVMNPLKHGAVDELSIRTQ
jgi:hypothetical protein